VIKDIDETGGKILKITKVKESIEVVGEWDL
jgi:hypothetical protein